METGLVVDVEDPVARQEIPSQARGTRCPVGAGSGEEKRRGKGRVAPGERSLTRECRPRQWNGASISPACPPDELENVEEYRITATGDRLLRVEKDKQHGMGAAVTCPRQPGKPPYGTGTDWLWVGTIAQIQG